MKRRVFKLVSILALPCLALLFSGAAPPSKTECDQLRTKAEKLTKQGNWKEAWEEYEKIILSLHIDPVRIENDLHQAINCLRRINRTPEMDAFIEKAVDVHAKNWRLLRGAAWAYFNTQHYGFIIAGEFHRGHHRGGGKYVNSFERDRVRSLQLMELAMKAVEGEPNKGEAAELHLEFARMLMGHRGYQGAWQ